MIHTHDSNGNQRSVETPSAAMTTSLSRHENQQSEQIRPDGTRTTFTYSFVNKAGMEYFVQKETGSGAGVETVKYI